MVIDMHIVKKEWDIPGKLKSFLILSVFISGLFVLLKYILPWITPFIVALMFALVIEPAVEFLTTHFRFSRTAASGLLTLLLLGLLAFVVSVFAGRLAGELTKLVLEMPGIIERLALWFEGITLRVSIWMQSGAPGLGAILLPLLESLPGELARLAGSVSGLLLGALHAAAKRAPEIMLFAVTTGVGTYFISGEYEEITQFIKNQIPEEHRSRVRGIFESLMSSAGSWLKVQLILTVITFFELLLALMLLRTEYAVVMAAIISVVDLLPILGTGALLIPWALAAFVSGDVSFAIGIVITWAAVTLLRNLMQAKLVGEQLGLDPLVSLLSMYVGFRAIGVVGMIAMPFAVIVIIQLNDRGVLKLWERSREREGREEMDISENMQKRKSKTV